MRTVYLTIGFTGSGKSTFARNFIKDKPNVKIVSPDGFRQMFNSEYKYIVKLDDAITQSTFDAAKNLLVAGYDVVIDCGNLTKSLDRRGLWVQLPAEKFVAYVMPMDQPVNWYVERRMQKPHWAKVDFKEIVKNEMKAYESPTLDEFDKICHVSEKGEYIDENSHRKRCSKVFPTGRI